MSAGNDLIGKVDLPFCQGIKIKISVMTFVTLAGFLLSSAPFSYIICPVDASMRTAEGADIWIAV